MKLRFLVVLMLCCVFGLTPAFALQPGFLNVSKTGTGSGTVSSNPAGIDCGTICSITFYQGWSIDLTATPATGSSFTGWSGACTGTGTCTVLMTAVNNVTANFDVLPATQLLDLVLNGTGTGSVLSSPNGIECPKKACKANFLEKAIVTLTAIPEAGSSFVSWNGLAGCKDSILTCDVTMDVAQSGKITFDTTPIPTFALTITKVGLGTISSVPAGIDCGTTCSNSFDQNTVVTLTATPASGSSFTGWSGACTGTGTCSITMDAVKTVSANFDVLPATYALYLHLGGPGGSVSSSPAGIDCGGLSGVTCGYSFNQNTVVTLTATPKENWRFTGWSQACTGIGTCVVTMDAVKDLTASFEPIVFALNISKAGTGAGTVSSAPAGIDCGTICSATLYQNWITVLTATPAAGSSFTGWSGACTGTGTCRVLMNAIKNVTATFTVNPPVTFTLTITKNGSGTGSVSSSPAGIDCGATCSATFNQDSSVALIATPANGSVFAGWTGACIGTGACTGAVRAVTATFNTAPVNTFALTVNKAGTGAGTVSSNPAGIDCGSSCTTSFNQNTVVTLTATPTTGSSFMGWSGACTGSGACTITMDAVKNVTATFAPVTFALNISKVGAGTISSAPAGINCGATCSATFNQGSSVVLTATPAAGSSFTGWSGACTGTGTCTVAMDAIKNVTATFTVNPPVTFALTITKAGTGTGAVSSDPVGIDCGSSCTTNFNESTVVTLTATPVSGSSFTGWSGACSGTGTCSVTMDAVKNVTATFTLNTFALNMTKSGTGTGAISSDPAGIDCGTTCTANFNSGSSITLTATPSAGSSFTGWGGACTGTGTCSITMDAVKNVTATFAPITFALNVTKTGTGAGTISSVPVGIDCGATCNATFNQGSSVVLTATPAAGSSFTGWNGACSGTETCTVTMDAIKNVTASFAAIPLGIILSTATNPPVDKVVTKGSIDNAALAFALTLPNSKLTSLTLSVNGTGNDINDLTSVKVYADTNRNGVVDAGEVVVANGKFSADNGTVVLTPSTAIALSASGATQFLVVVDVNSSLAAMRVIPVLGGLLMLGLGIRRRRWIGMLGLAVLLSSCGNEPVITTYQLKLEGLTVKVGSTTVKVVDLPVSGATLSVQK